MVISNTNFAKFFFLLVLVVSINACKKDIVAETKPNVTVPPSPLLKADKQSVNPLEIVSLSSQNIALTQSSYSGSIGGYAVKLVSYENKLGFQMPDLPAGNYTLETSIEGSSFSISLNVLALANIADPETYIQTARNKFEYSSSYLNTLANGMNNMNGSENNSANINILNNYALDLQNKINASSASDKAALARFIAANPLLFAPLDDPSSYIDSLNLHKIYDYSDDRIKTIAPEMANKIFNLGLVTVVGVSLQVIALASPEPVTKLLAFAGWTAVAFRVYNLNSYLITQMDKSLIQVGQLIVDNIHKTNSPYQFTKDVPYTFELSSAYRNLSSQDMSSSSSTVLNIISSLNTYGTYWNKAMNFLPTSLFGSPFHIKNVSSSKSKIWKMKPDYLSIGNISNNYVKVSVNNGGGSLKTTFTTSLSVDQSFNFDIIYTNPGVSSGKSNNAGNLIASSILGLWDLDNASTHTWVVSCPSQMDTCKMGIYTCTMNILADSSFTLTTQIKTTYYNITFKDLYDQNICQVISDGPNTDVFQNINYSGKVRGNNMIFDMDGDGNLDQLPIIKFGPELYITLNLYVNALKQNRPFDLYFNK